jgi:hypothetical protein
MGEEPSDNSTAAALAQLMLANNGCRVEGCGAQYETDPADPHFPFISGVCYHTICKRCIDRTVEEERGKTASWKGYSISCPVCGENKAFNLRKLIKNAALADIIYELVIVERAEEPASDGAAEEGDYDSEATVAMG